MLTHNTKKIYRACIRAHNGAKESFLRNGCFSPVLVRLKMKQRCLLILNFCYILVSCGLFGFFGFVFAQTYPFNRKHFGICVLINLELIQLRKAHKYIRKYI